MAADKNETEKKYDYIVVGSGAGGGVVAARLALAGHTVLLLEAGGDPLKLEGGGPVGKPGENRLTSDYEVPCFHAMSTENEAMKWDFFVRHYKEDSERDDKFVPEKDGVLYPRAGTLGGCTAHNALIMVYPHNEDWNHIAKITGDRSWRARNMRRYFQRLENCRHRWPYRILYRLTGLNLTRHGFGGWLSIEKAVPFGAVGDHDLIKIVVRAAKRSLKELVGWRERIRWFIQSQGDPNDWRLVKQNAIGVRYAPLHTHKHARNSTREFLLDVARRHPDRLKIELNALATKVLFDNSNRAIGVAFLRGEKLYRAAHQPNPRPGEPDKAFAFHEVILAGGAFNTPQLLMLSGIGPRKQLDKHGIPLRVDLPGVGTNLQDRYEVGVVNRLKHDWALLKDVTFTRHDRHWRQWARWRKGTYTTNGAALAIIKRSLEERPLPDLFIFALIGYFKGYLPGYSKLIADSHNYLTWCILKAHTENRGGHVKLRSNDPRDPPKINFKYFDEGTDTEGKDAESLVAGIRFVRTLTADAADVIEAEELPSPKKQTDEELSTFVKSNAWGHHASCTCPIGPADDPMAVLDSNFQVYGTSNLRVVDASVFPRIPGFFIVSCVYMIAEKASDAILAAAGHKISRGLYGQGLWCGVWRGLRRVVHGIRDVLRAVRRAAKAFLGVLGLVLVLLVAVVGVSWFICEPPPANADPAKEALTVRSLTNLVTRSVTDGRQGVAQPGAHILDSACLKGNVTISPHISPGLKVAFLKGRADGGQTYRAWIRFSNMATTTDGNLEGPLRAMAVKLLGVSGERLPYPGDEQGTQDLLFVSHDTYFAGNPQQFSDFYSACLAGGSCSPLRNPRIAWHMLTHPRGAYNYFRSRSDYASIADIKWYSVTPYALGEPPKDDKDPEPLTVKYAAFPCSGGGQTKYGTDGAAPDYLIGRLRDRLDPSLGNHLCLQLKMQVAKDPVKQPIENALVPWDGVVWQQAATIDITPQNFTSAPQQEFCERMSFNPWHGLRVHRPVGGINRALRELLPVTDRLRLEAANLTPLASRYLGQ